MHKLHKEFIENFEQVLKEHDEELKEVEMDIKEIRKILETSKRAVSSISPDAKKIPIELKEFLKLMKNLQMESKQYKNIIHALKVKYNSAIEAVTQGKNDIVVIF